ncbi:MAG: hypothetical protein H6Q48_2538 [Deltaproteobacteria bacterium]|nr:hypothetical protein [Deltaproteobacteria bacterium]
MVLLGEDTRGEGLIQGITMRNKKVSLRALSFLFKVAVTADVSHLERERTLL